MPSATEYARGVFIVHSAPSVLAPHIEWALASEIGTPVTLRWEPQQALASSAGAHTVRCDAEWRAPIGSGARIASALLGWRGVRFEITEFGTDSSDGGRWIHTPSLGILHHTVDHAGNALLSETTVRDLLARGAGNPELLQRLFERALGAPWDAELDIFRAAGSNETAEILRSRRTVS